jgi:hypothetical protein
MKSQLKNSCIWFLSIKHHGQKYMDRVSYWHYPEILQFLGKNMKEIRKTEM